MRTPVKLITMMGGGDRVKPTPTIALSGAAASVAAMLVTFDEPVTGFEVGDITISAGGSLANFAGSGASYTVDWTLAAGANTMDIAAGVCQDIAGNENGAAAQKTVTLATTTLQATGTTDTYIKSNAATSNFGTDTSIRVGELNGVAGENYRTLLKFDLSGINAQAIVQSAVLSLRCATDWSGAATTYRCFRQKRVWTGAGATWNKYDGASDWQTAGGFGADDCEQADIGNRAFVAAETLNEFKDFALTASKVEEWIDGTLANNGLLIKADAELNDAYFFDSFNHATAENRPKLIIVTVL